MNKKNNKLIVCDGCSKGKDITIEVTSENQSNTLVNNISIGMLDNSYKKMLSNEIFKTEFFKTDIDSLVIISDFFNKIEVYSSYFPTNHISIFVFGESTTFSEISKSFVKLENKKLLIDTWINPIKKNDNEYLRLLIILPKCIMDKLYFRTKHSDIYLDTSIFFKKIFINALANNITIFSLFELLDIETTSSVINVKPNIDGYLQVSPLSIVLSNAYGFNNIDIPDFKINEQKIKSNN